ncbi:hypothetical protein CBW46_019610 [Paenibacillus xerothermodurans]|uniref:Uncharacterized protein n=1 Tax=Paenibacillus xerothermodurans TaxID=1977292 RepID=A0A2W1N486_PAEXE|nr:hypothetical protein CBW46_019610 [Paenibacillus xerothermodurans]
MPCSFAAVLALYFIWDLPRRRPFVLSASMIMIEFVYMLLTFLYFHLKEKAAAGAMRFQPSIAWIG